MKLVLLGHTRSGTTSIWTFFKKHPEVSVSVSKEFILENLYDLSNFVEDAFCIHNQTKVLLDGSPDLFYSDRIDLVLDSIKKYPIINEVVLIYSIREAIEHLISVTNASIRRYLNGHTQECNFLDEKMNINKEKFHFFCQKYLNHHYNYLITAEKKIGRKNLFLVNLSDFERKQLEIFNFLDISTNKIYKFPKINTSWELGYTFNQLKLKSQTIKLINDKRDEYEAIIQKNEQKRKERYGI